MNLVSYTSFVVLFTGVFVTLLKLTPIPPSAAYLAYVPVAVIVLAKLTMSLKQIFALALILFAVTKFVNGQSSLVIDGLKQIVFIFLILGILNDERKIDFERQAKLILFFSSILGLIGIMQLFGVEPLKSISPLPNTDFTGSGGFADFTILRPNYALGNSINTGTFFVLNIFIVFSIWSSLSNSTKLLLPILFLMCLGLTLSRAAFLALIIFTPFIISKVGVKPLIIPMLAFFWLAYDWLILLKLRFFDRAYTVGSDNDRAEMFGNFFRNFDTISIIFGNVNGSTDLKITDGWIMYNLLGFGVLFTVVFIYCLIWPARLRISNPIQYFSLVGVFILITAINNSIHAFYNIWLLVFSFRISQCINQSQYFSRFTTVKSF